MPAAPAASVANQLAPLAERLGSVLDPPLALRPATDAHAVVRRAAALQDTAFLKTASLPPVLLHPSGQPNSNWLYGRTRASPHADAAYKPGKFDLFGKRRHERMLLGAAIMQCSDELAEPALLYQLEHEGRTILVAHVYSAPLAQLEADLFDAAREPTPFEAALHGDAETAAQLVQLRATMGAYMRGSGLAALPGYLLTGDYHLRRPGILPMLRLRSPETDLELEILERVCMTALHHHLHGLAGEQTRGPSPIAPEDALCTGVNDFLALFDRCEDEFEYLNRMPNLPDADLGSHWLQARAYKAERWADACKLARRQVVVPLAAALLKHGLEEDFGVSAEDVSEASARGSAVELEEASEMARSRDRERVARLPEFKEPVPLSQMMGMCPGTWRLRRMGYESSSRNNLVETTNQIFENATDAELAARDVDPWEPDTGDGNLKGRAGRCCATWPSASTSRKRCSCSSWSRASGSSRSRCAAARCSMARCGPERRRGCSASRGWCPWLEHLVRPAQRPADARADGRGARQAAVTNAMRVRYGAQPRPCGFARGHRAAQARLLRQARRRSRPSRRFVSRALAAHVPARPGSAATARPPSETRVALGQAIGALQRGMRKRTVEALSWS